MGTGPTPVRRGPHAARPRRSSGLAAVGTTHTLVMYLGNSCCPYHVQTRNCAGVLLEDLDFLVVCFFVSPSGFRRARRTPVATSKHRHRIFLETTQIEHAHDCAVPRCHVYCPVAVLAGYLLPCTCIS